MNKKEILKKLVDQTNTLDKVTKVAVVGGVCSTLSALISSGVAKHHRRKAQEVETSNEVEYHRRMAAEASATSTRLTATAAVCAVVGITNVRSAKIVREEKEKLAEINANCRKEVKDELSDMRNSLEELVDKAISTGEISRKEGRKTKRELRKLEPEIVALGAALAGELSEEQIQQVIDNLEAAE